LRPSGISIRVRQSIGAKDLLQVVSQNQLDSLYVERGGRRIGAARSCVSRSTRRWIDIGRDVVSRGITTISLRMELLGMVTYRVTNVEVFPIIMLRALPPSLAVHDLGISNFCQLQFLLAVPVEARSRKSRILHIVGGK